VVGGGKAGAPMAAAVAGTLGERITAGALNIKSGHTRYNHAARGALRASGNIRPPKLHLCPGRPCHHGCRPRPHRLTEAGHPVPDQKGQTGTRNVGPVGRVELARPGDRAAFGGGSALLPLPAPGLTLASLGALTSLLLACGAGITEINGSRTIADCSQIRGRPCSPAWPAPARGGQPHSL